MMRGMIKARRRSPTMNPLPFQLDPEPATETLTSYGGVPLVVQAFRSLGLPQAIEQRVRIKQRERGYDEATMIESFVILNAVGGECLEDFEQLRADAGLAELIGHAISVLIACPWRIPRIMRRSASGTTRDSASATGTTRSLSVMPVRQSLALAVGPSPRAR